jgi:hypothetical protein
VPIGWGEEIRFASRSQPHRVKVSRKQKKGLIFVAFEIIPDKYWAVISPKAPTFDNAPRKN